MKSHRDYSFRVLYEVDTMNKNIISIYPRVSLLDLIEVRTHCMQDVETIGFPARISAGSLVQPLDFDAAKLRLKKQT